jgi:AmmeMemoRadiSam system protein A
MIERGTALARYARETIGEILGGPAAARPEAPWSDELGATFVTLRWRDGDLQGCIGSLEAYQPIRDDVASNAVAAATRDPRNTRMELDDLDDLHVELSILSPLEKLASDREIRIGIDGIVIAYAGRRATFLPIMWEQMPTLEVFMTALKRKAGLPRDLSNDALQIWRYTVEHHTDPAPRDLS